jgi:cytochrome c-type biogenesis protein
MSFVFAFLAGLLTTLSPCVLPVLPFVTASSMSRNKLGPAFLGLGLLISFVGVSLVVSTTGQVFGLDPSVIRKTSGLLLMVSGFLFLSQRFADYFSEKLSFISGRASQMGSSDSNGGLIGEFVSGLLLGVVWTPCSGPSLGAALGLASQEGNFIKSASVLLIFGIGAVIPLLAFAYGAKHFLGRIKSHLGLIKKIKIVFGVLIVTFGFLIVFELDRNLEATLTGLLPDSWLIFITKF